LWQPKYPHNVSSNHAGGTSAPFLLNQPLTARRVHSYHSILDTGDARTFIGDTEWHGVSPISGNRLTLYLELRLQKTTAT
jgi:hypothetical protein